MANSCYIDQINPTSSSITHFFLSFEIYLPLQSSRLQRSVFPRIIGSSHLLCTLLMKYINTLYDTLWLYSCFTVPLPSLVSHSSHEFLFLFIRLFFSSGFFLLHYSLLLRCHFLDPLKDIFLKHFVLIRISIFSSENCPFSMFSH